MKKIFAFVAVAVMAVAGAFAMDLGAIQGTWQDEYYAANWTFSANGSITLTQTNGNVVYTFDDTNITDFKPIADEDGVGFSFTCAETQRKYKFVKPLTLTTDIKMVIDPDWTTEDYIAGLILQN